MNLFKSPPTDIVIDREKAGMEVDDTYFPYVTVTLQEYYIHSRQLRYFLTAMGDLYKRAVKKKQRMVLILDTRKLTYRMVESTFKYKIKQIIFNKKTKII